MDDLFGDDDDATTTTTLEPTGTVEDLFGDDENDAAADAGRRSDVRSRHHAPGGHPMKLLPVIDHPLPLASRRGVRSLLPGLARLLAAWAILAGLVAVAFAAFAVAAA
jgi:hypothetical protein